MTRLWIVLLAGLVFCRPIHAAIINAASPSEADVNTAYTAAVDGDIILIPAGTANWTNTLTIAKAITLRGAGIGQTIWLDEITSAAGNYLILSTTAGKKYRVTGIEFRKGVRASALFNGAIMTTGTSDDIRIDNCKFDQLLNAGVYVSGATLGVVDHSQWNLTTRHTIVTRNHQLYNSNFGYGSWETPIVPGSDQAFYYEDNIFNGDDSDAFGGGRAVWRFNTFTNSLIHTHGTESSGNYRAFRWHEIYGNTMIKDNSDSREFIDFRDGNGLIVSNTIINTGTAISMVGLNCYRARGPYTIWGGADATNPLDTNDVSGGIFDSGTVTTGTSGTGVSARTITDSTKSWTVDQWRGYTLRNMSSNYPTAYPFTSNYFSQIISNSATTITYFEHAVSLVMRFATGNSYEIRRFKIALDQVGSGASTPFDPDLTNTVTWPNQPREPLYQWSNTNAGALVTVTTGQGNIVEGRDFTNNAVHPTWTPFTYPHPLTASNTVSPSSGSVAPTGQIDFDSSGGFTPYLFVIQVNNSGGSIDSSTGLYTAGSTPSTDTVRVWDSFGNYSEAAVTVTGNSPPSITSQPSDATVMIGQSASFSVTATGDPTLVYQWYHDSVVIPGATSSTLNIPSATLSDAGDYHVNVSNPHGDVDSDTATLTVTTTTTTRRNKAIKLLR